MSAIFKYLYWACGAATIGMLVFVAPGGEFLTFAPAKGKIQAAPQSAHGTTTVRSHGPTFIWLGGGYHGGK